MFHYGDRGSLFYIIIEGEVEIRTPSPVELDNDSATAEGILVFIVTYFDDIYWEKIYQGQKIQQVFLKELMKLNVNLTDGRFTKHDALKTLDLAIARGDSKIHIRMENLLNPFHKKTLTLHWFKTVAKIPMGGSFGERALIKNEDRAASIICSKNCSFATLSRKDYNTIIGAAQKRELK